MGVATTYNPGSKAVPLAAGARDASESALPFPMSRFNAILLLAAAFAVAPPAFPDDAPQSTTTRARIIGPQAPQPVPPSAQPEPPKWTQEEIDPATGLARSTVVRPLHELPELPGARPPASGPATTPNANAPRTRAVRSGPRAHRADPPHRFARAGQARPGGA